MSDMNRAIINYVARTDFRQRYYANDHSRDTVVIDGQEMDIHNGRSLDVALEREGFKLVRHESAVGNFEDKTEVAAVHAAEIIELLKAETDADAVFVTAPGILRFSETSGRAGQLDNSMPARFAHIDASRITSAGFAERSCPDGRTYHRYAHFNIWRSFSGPPQDVPLAICDALSVDEADLLAADAVFDPPGDAPEWSFESWLIAHNPRHRWHWFPHMTRDEAIIFKTSDSEYNNPVPHVAFDNRQAPPDCHPRASIEMRAVAFWFD